MGYKKKGDENFSEAGNPHGSKNQNNYSSKRLNLFNSSARMLNPSYVFNVSRQQILSFMFVQYYDR